MVQYSEVGQLIVGMKFKSQTTANIVNKTNKLRRQLRYAINVQMVDYHN